MTNPTDSQIVSKVIRQRRTQKILAVQGCSVEYADEELTAGDSIVMAAIADAGFAPFHYDRNLNSIAEPWRFYFVGNSSCRYLASKLEQWYPDMKPTNKLPAMLAACGSLVLVNWLPQFSVEPADEKQRQVNEEHLAATAAATQNLLLSLTACGMKTYWSSGGFFRTGDMKTRLGIDLEERLLAAIFIDYGAEQNVEVIGGKQHHNRSEYRVWTKVVEVHDQNSTKLRPEI